MLHRLKGRPTAYVIAAILGVAGIGGLSSAVAQQGQGQGQTTQGQGQGQGQTSQGQGQTGRGATPTPRPRRRVPPRPASSPRK